MKNAICDETVVGTEHHMLVSFKGNVGYLCDPKELLHFGIFKGVRGPDKDKCLVSSAQGRCRALVKHEFL